MLAECRWISVSVSLMFVLVACSGPEVKKSPGENGGDGATTEYSVPLLEPKVSEDPNWLIGPEFEVQLMSPFRKLEAALTMPPGKSPRTGIACMGKKKNSKPEGRWACRNWKGKRVISVFFRKGQKNGWAREWSDEGKLICESYWMNDQQTGDAKTSTGQDKAGVTGSFKQNLRNGLFTKFDAAGGKIGITKYENGKRNGEARLFYASGNLKQRLTYVDDVASGESSAWYENGNIESHGLVKGGRPVGPWQYWSEDGKTSKERVLD
ncbi:hypothetical protein BH10BDE1_BH10BDE1_09320 [soil metagenome]